MWFYQGKEFTSDMIGDYIGFVYMITDQSNNKKYIGRKTLVSKRKLPPLKGQKRKRTKIVESDWKTYFGSSDEVKNLVEEKGKDNFYREILHLCKSKGILSYLETKEIIQRDALLLDEYYNMFVGCKIHSSHLKDLKE
jgi:hypothetical protein